MATVILLAEYGDGGLGSAAPEMVSAARDVADAVGGNVDALVLGRPPSGLSLGRLARFGADRVCLAGSESDRGYDPEHAVWELEALVRRAPDCYAVLMPSSELGDDVAARLAARLDVPLAEHATALKVEEGELVITRSVYGDNLMAEVVLGASPRLVSLAPSAVVARERPRALRLERLPGADVAKKRRVRFRSFTPSTADGHDLCRAQYVVSGGRGLQSGENWKVLVDLCDALGPAAALGASRVPVAAGWRPYSEQVGQTAAKVAPRFYFAIGISGAVQHMVGIRKARTIVAVNMDPYAPIFRSADYGIVGDALEVVPRLAEEIRRLRSSDSEADRVPTAARDARRL